MATKKELIEDIKLLGTEGEDFNNLNGMKKGELEQLLEYLKRVNEFNKTKEEPVIPKKIDMEYNESGWDIEVEEDDFIEEPEFIPDYTGEYIKHKEGSELSNDDIRTLARTGVLPPKRNSSKYTRFNDTNIKQGF